MAQGMKLFLISCHLRTLIAISLIDAFIFVEPLHKEFLQKTEFLKAGARISAGIVTQEIAKNPKLWIIQQNLMASLTAQSGNIKFPCLLYFQNVQHIGYFSTATFD